MKILSSLIFILFLLLSSCTISNRLLMYVGTYTNGESEGIYSYYFDQQTGEIEQAFVTANKQNPSFLAISPNKKFLFSVAEVREGAGFDSGSVASYKILDDGKLEKINQESTKGLHPCHVAVSPDGKTVVASNYSSGSLSLFHVDENGSLSKSFQQIQHKGSGPNPKRQQKAFAHSALFDKSGEVLISADLGNDKIEFYTKIEKEKFSPTPQAFVKMNPGAGPRHFDFSPDQNYIYVMNELDATVTVLKKNAGRYDLVQTANALPAEYSGMRSGADIHVNKDGRFVYSSNRGHNSIAIFSRDTSSGEITLLETESVRGDWPRNFALSPNGKFLLVANQNSNNIAVFRVEKETGLLEFTGVEQKVPSPVCIKFLTD